MGRDGDDFVWAVGIVVGDEDEIQTVEIDQHGAKSSRMLTPGELFEGLEILASPGEPAHVIVGTVTLLGMELRASDATTAHDFAGLLREAADDRNWRLPLHLIGQPRDLQLSAQGREILRQTAMSIEQEGHGRTTLSAASRLELSAQTLDSIRRRIARKSLQAYRMHGRWYVVLDNLSRSRSSDLNGTTTADVPAQPTAPEIPSPFEEAPEQTQVEQEHAVATEIALEEPFVAPAESSELAQEETIHLQEEEIGPISQTTEAEELPEAPTEDDLAAFVSESAESESEPITQELPVAASAEPEELSVTDAAPELAAEAAEEQPVAEEAPSEPEQAATEQQGMEADEQPGSSLNHVDQFISESVLDQFVIADAETFPPSAETAAEPAMQTEADVVSEQPSAHVAEQIEELVPESELEAATEEAVDASLEAPTDVEEVESVVAESTLVEAEPESVESDLTDESVSPVAETHEEPSDEFQVAAPEVTDEAEVLEEEGSDVAADESQAESLAGESEPTTDESDAGPEPQGDEETQALQEPIFAAAESEEHVVLTSAEEAEAVAEPAESEAMLEAEEETEPAPPVADEAEVVEAETEPEAASDQAEDIEIRAESEPGEQAHEAMSEPEEQPEAEAAEDVEISAEAEAESEEASEQAEDVEIAAESEAGEEAHEETPESEEAFASTGFVGPDLNLLMHLRNEVDFLRQQGQEKDRQIVAWINGAQWLQPFVDQIRSLEQQVERLGELQAKRDGDRISDLMSERDSLRQRLESLETEIMEARSAQNAADANRRSWFRRMMSSD